MLTASWPQLARKMPVLAIRWECIFVCLFVHQEELPTLSYYLLLTLECLHSTVMNRSWSSMLAELFASKLMLMNQNYPP